MKIKTAIIATFLAIALMACNDSTGPQITELERYHLESWSFANEDSVTFTEADFFNGLNSDESWFAWIDLYASTPTGDGSVLGGGSLWVYVEAFGASIPLFQGVWAGRYFKADGINRLFFSVIAMSPPLSGPGLLAGELNSPFIWVRQNGFLTLDYQDEVLSVQVVFRLEGGQ